MKTVVFYQNNGTNDDIFNPHARDNCSDPFIYLKERINALGYEVVLANEYSEVPNCAAILFFTPPFIISYKGIKGKVRWIKHLLLGNKKIVAKTIFYESCIKKGLLDKMVLMLWEGPSVSPGNYDKYLHVKFNHILTWADAYVDDIKYKKFYLPVSRQESIKEIVPFKNKKLLINISINKNSNFKRELYSERRKTMEYFDKNFSNDFDLYGLGWNKLMQGYNYKFGCYRGSLKNKIDVLSNYKFALAYENLRDEPGYITEKIFDCLRAGTVPIYWGASNINDYVDQAAFIDRRKFRSNKELANFITSVSENDYQNYVTAGQRYLASDKFKLFLPDHFVTTVINALKLD